MSNKIKEAVEVIQYKLKLSQEEIAARIGYSRPYLTKAITIGTSKKVYDRLKREFSEILQTVTNDTNKNTDDQQLEVTSTSESNEHNSLSFSLLQSMVENTSKLVVANADLAKSNLTLAESNARQTKMLELKLLPPADAGQQILPGAQPIESEILVKIVEGGLESKYWTTFQEGSAVVRRWISVLSSPKKEVRTQSDAGKIHK